MQKLGNFTPKNLVEALNALDKSSHPDGIEPFSSTTEEMLGDKWMHTLGKTIMTEWRLGMKSHIDVYFRNQGIDDAHQMAQIIILAFHRKLNNEPCSLETVKTDVASLFK